MHHIHACASSISSRSVRFLRCKSPQTERFAAHAVAMPPIPMRKGHHGRRFSAAPSSAPVERRRIGVAPQHTKRAPKRSRIRADTATLHAPLHPRKRKHKHRSRDPDKSRKKKARLEIEAAETEEEGEEEERKWVFSPRDCSEYKERIVVVSYNILGVENASRHIDLYDRVQPQYLNWEWRKKLICKEIGLYMPGILCFQVISNTEVSGPCLSINMYFARGQKHDLLMLEEVDHFDDLADLLHEDGFEGIYKGRTGEACDGCAIFWREEQFSLLHKEDLEFQKFGLRDNVAQFCVLKMNPNYSKSLTSDSSKPQMARTTPSRSILVGNIHVLFNPNRGDIKMGQVRLFLEKAQRLSQVWGNIPVILAGDLNSMPQSAIYQFVASSKLDILMHDRRNMSGKIDHPSSSKPFSNWNAAVSRSWMPVSNPIRYRWSEEEIQFAAGNRRCTLIQHHLKLNSAYQAVPGNLHTRDNNGEPLVTSYHSKFMGTVDYIWHSEELIAVGVVDTLPTNILRKTGGLPSEKWGSDHLALVCELAFGDDVQL